MNDSARAGITAISCTFIGALCGWTFTGMGITPEGAKASDWLGFGGAIIGVVGAFASSVFLAHRTERNSYNRNIDLIISTIEYSVERMDSLVKRLNTPPQPVFSTGTRSILIRQLDEIDRITANAHAGISGIDGALLVAFNSFVAGVSAARTLVIDIGLDMEIPIHRNIAISPLIEAGRKTAKNLKGFKR